ncbi:MAG: P-loop NTPase [Coriobacteriales bacterium]|jgi:pilus assembly protein CpaE|nr:P-loop NTPase [Coriobacteriales bacterium]
MSEQVVAYLLPASPDEGFGGSLSEGANRQAPLLGEQGVLDVIVGVSRKARMLASSEECRNALRLQSPAVSVIVCNRSGVGLVTPINLAAALCSDTPERDVYLLEDTPTESLASRACVAGIRGILNTQQAQRLLGVEWETPVGPLAPSTPLVSLVPSVAPVSLVSAEQPAALGGGEVLGLAMGRENELAPNEASRVGEEDVSATDEPVADELSVSKADTRPLPLVALQASQPADILPFPAASSDAVVFDNAVRTAAPLAQGRVVGFFSGRGGVGKSAVSLMTALAAQKRGLRVGLVDLDLQFGDMSYLAGKESASRIQRFSLAQLCTNEMPPLATEAMTLVVAPARPEQGEQLAPALPRLLEGLALQRDLIVLNTGSFWTDVHAKAVQRCDHIVFLMDQRATSIEACKQAVDLCLRLQAPQARFLFALNGCGRHAALSVQDVSFALGGVEVAGLADGGALVDELLSLGCPLELLSSGNAFVASLEGLLDALVGHASASAAYVVATDGTGRKEKRQAGIFDLTSLRNFFGGAYRVAT